MKKYEKRLERMTFGGKICSIENMREQKQRRREKLEYELLQINAELERLDDLYLQIKEGGEIDIIGGK